MPVLTSFDQLRSAVRGPVITPEDDRYESARAVWNGMIDKRPAVIVRASGAADVAPTIAHARATGLPLAIRGAGHNVAGNGTVEGGIVLDLGGLNAVDVDPAARLVRVEAGATLGDIDRATEPHGLAVPVGVVSGTGIGGLALGGGVGWLVRAYGLTIDNLVSADVILAHGEPVRASADEHPDLFWGLRGGGGNFGVVTAFTFRAHPLVQDVLAGTLVYARSRWSEALPAYVEWVAGLPDELSTMLTFLVPPPEFGLGSEVIMVVGFAWAGADRRSGEALIDGFRAVYRPDVAGLDPTTWLAYQSSMDAVFPRGSRAYWRNASFDRLDAAMIDTVIEHAEAQGWVGTGADIHHMGGAFGRVQEDATAYPSRAGEFLLNAYGFWSDPGDDAAGTAWVKGFSDAMRPHAIEGQYVNFLGHDDVDANRKALAAYGPEKLARLSRVKRRYDPENLFRINHNISPASA
ncbi:MAG: FAD-binding oxidoreductase [Chloroflexi bacterium]|nr:FAD-binding oxidoreductase [Chloroflexota bacterium]